MNEVARCYEEGFGGKKDRVSLPSLVCEVKTVQRIGGFELTMSCYLMTMFGRAAIKWALADYFF